MGCCLVKSPNWLEIISSKERFCKYASWELMLEWLACLHSIRFIAWQHLKAIVAIGIVEISIDAINPKAD